MLVMISEETTGAAATAATAAAGAAGAAADVGEAGAVGTERDGQYFSEPCHCQLRLKLPLSFFSLIGLSP